MRGVSIPRPQGVRGANTMKPYPLVSDLWEPALRVAMPRAPRLLVGQELASRPRRIQEFSAEGCPVPFFGAQRESRRA